MTDEKAPVCPISHSQQATFPRGGSPVARLPVIPIATDLASLIRAVNITRDILRTITTSLTVNNTYLPQDPRAPRQPGSRTYILPSHPEWDQESTDGPSGYVGKDPKHRAYINRTNEVVFEETYGSYDSNKFRWFYDRPLDGGGGGANPFTEDFFERVVQVHWAPTGPSGPPAPSGPTGPPFEQNYYANSSWSGRGGPSIACVFFGYSHEKALADAAAAAAANPNLIYLDANPQDNSFTLVGWSANTWYVAPPYVPWPGGTPGNLTWLIIFASPYSSEPGFDPHSVSIVGG